jgi:ATP-dependent helicase HrpB
VSLTPLPIDSHVDGIRAALDRHRAAVLTAAPGAGKTTRVPPALVDRGRVLLLQPRRVAARAMAARIGEERNWAVGHEVGWHIRFDRQFNTNTRLLVVTEGILTAYFQRDPLLSDVSTLVLDEFHERSVHADLGLALAKLAWTARDDLRILVMSATLDPAPVAAFLGDCPVIEVPGTSHPLTIEYGPGEPADEALLQTLRRTEGDVLFFLPGRREIAQAMSVATKVALAHGCSMAALHGSISADDQQYLLRPHTRRRIVMATNIAETSLTVPNISAVIDSGLHKVARFDPDRAVDSLVTERIPADSADQRAGRAARLGPGLVRRLWDARDRLRPQREAEIHRIDLSAPALAILAAGADLDGFEWFDRPSRERLAAAVELLTRLGAVQDGRITPLGREMQRLPLPPRHARIVLEAGGAFEACAACAWLSEPTRLGGPAPASSSDLLTVLDRWKEMPMRVRQIAGQVQRAITPTGNAATWHVDDTALRRAVLAGYPDRVGKRRAADKVTLASGHGAVLGRETGVHDADWLIALDVTAGRTSAHTEALIRVASRIETEWLNPTRSNTEVTIDESGAVRAHEVDYYGELVLAERSVPASHEARVTILTQTWLDRVPDERSARLIARLAFAGLDVDLSGIVRTAAATATRLQDIVLTDEHLPWATRQTLDRQAPQTLRVPSGREMALHYESDGTVSVAVKLQELFGLGETPAIGPHRMPITFHLLAPNGRPVQTTRDLKSFWERTYPEVRKELRGRYPRHPWPDDPWNATPTHKTKRR